LSSQWKKSFAGGSVKRAPNTRADTDLKKALVKEAERQQRERGHSETKSLVYPEKNDLSRAIDRLALS